MQVKAIIIEKFGGLEELKLSNVPKPVPAENEVLIRTAYSAVNPVDWKIREGYLADMFPHKFPLILGWDVAGTVDSIGAAVTQFKPGDRVFAYARKPEVQGGTYAEYVTLNAQVVAIIPDAMTMEQAATVPLVGLTAFQSLYDVTKIKKGMSVLVHAGAGGVGGFAIQFAKLAGAKVITTTSRKNISYVKSLGADQIVDYTTEDFQKVLQHDFAEGVDVVFDTIGGEALARSYSVIKKGGSLVSIVQGPDAAHAEAGNFTASFHFVNGNAVQLAEIGKLISAGEVKTPETLILPLEDVKKAHALSRSARTRGKILLKI